MKGAAFSMACMSEAQKSSVDMLMYYDAKCIGLKEDLIFEVKPNTCIMIKEI